ncbi:gamma-glutamyl-gamma-aminobutyrate hydrolase [Clostridia bacterium]|nr:gamma-glutamyl-gamma-aminobutyrate hydrolase [Clostridia bacterium]
MSLLVIVPLFLGFSAMAETAVGLSWMQDTSNGECPEDLQVYIDALELIGAKPVLLPLITNEDEAEAAIQTITALVMTGGEDINPVLFGQEPDSMLETLNDARDLNDMLLLRAAIDADIPVLGTCRGMQVLNVLYGGTLYQDIPTMLDTSIKHRSDDEIDFVFHDITIETGTFVDQIMGGTKQYVNSWHHQAIKDLGKGLKVTAVSSDGIIEAVELPGYKFVLGIQFHPEWHIAEGQPEFKVFFERLVAEAE